MRGYESHKLSVILTKVRIQSHEAMPLIILDPDFRQDDGVTRATPPRGLRDPSLGGARRPLAGGAWGGGDQAFAFSSSARA